jgi:ATP-dependent Zn protease
MANRDGDDRKGRGRWQGFDFGGGSGQSGRNPWRFLILYVVVGVLLLALLRTLASPGPARAQLSDFYGQLGRDQIKSVTITASSVDWTSTQNVNYSAILPPNFDTSTLVQQLQQQHVPQFKGQQPSALASFLLQWILPFGILALLWLFVIRSTTARR